MLATLEDQSTRLYQAKIGEILAVRAYILAKHSTHAELDADSSYELVRVCSMLEEKT